MICCFYKVYCYLNCKFYLGTVLPHHLLTLKHPPITVLAHLSGGLVGELIVFVCFEAFVPVKKNLVMCRPFPVLLSRANIHLSTECSKVTFCDRSLSVSKQNGHQS